MSLRGIIEDLNKQQKWLLRDIFNQIHAYPNATRQQAEDYLQGLIDAYPVAAANIDPVEFLKKAAAHVQVASWDEFKAYVLGFKSVVVEQWVRSQGDTKANTPLDERPTPAKMLMRYIMKNDGVVSHIRDTSGMEWKRNFVLTKEATDGEYTVRQDYDPQFDGTETDPNPLGWEIVDG